MGTLWVLANVELSWEKLVFVVVWWGFALWIVTTGLHFFDKHFRK